MVQVFDYRWSLNPRKQTSVLWMLRKSASLIQCGQWWRKLIAASIKAVTFSKGVSGGRSQPGAARNSFLVFVDSSKLIVWFFITSGELLENFRGLILPVTTILWGTFFITWFISTSSRLKLAAPDRHIFGTRCPAFPQICRTQGLFKELMIFLV